MATLQPPVARFSWDTPADLGRKETQDRLSAPAIKSRPDPFFSQFFRLELGSNLSSSLAG